MYTNITKMCHSCLGCTLSNPTSGKSHELIYNFPIEAPMMVLYTVLASQHGYEIAATNSNDSIVSNGESIANFGAAATQESVKLQGKTITSMQNQLNAMSQYCMALQQQATPTNHTAQHQRGASNSQHGLAQRNGNGGGGGGGGGYQQQCIHSQEWRANVQITPPCRTSASKTGTTATLTVAASTMGTPAGHPPIQALCTIHM
jgi:hypothetical protein